MRRILGLLAVIGLVTAISPATVAAAKPIRDGLTQSGILCEVATDAGFVSVFAEVVGDGSFASLAVWSPGSDPFEDMADILTLSGSAAFDGSLLTADFELVTVEEPTDPEDPPIFEPAGRASVSALLTPTGENFDSGRDDVRDGNVLIRRGMTVELMSVEGTVTVDLLDGTRTTAPLTGCGSSTTTQTIFVTNPNAYVLGGNQRFIECRWETAQGFVELRGLSDDFGSNRTELIVVDGDTALVGLSTPEYRNNAYLAGYELFDAMTREVVASASADASLSPSGERINDHEWVDATRFSLVGNRMTPDGMLTISTERGTTSLTMDDAACDATDLRVRLIEKIAQG